MRLHSLEHEPSEGLANIHIWAQERGHSISRTQLFKHQNLPDMNDFDFLFIMGGSMNIYEEEKYPWLALEKDFIHDAIEHGKLVLGICLGAQLLADVLGGKVTRNRYREIGWFPVTLTREAGDSPVFSALPEQFPAFHWHGDTFTIPPGASRIASSDGCANQAFEQGPVIGLQFHLEYSVKSISLMLQHCAHEIVVGKYIQNPDVMASLSRNVEQTRSLMNLLLDAMERRSGKRSDE